ncbi:MAG: hypothetical protein K0Q75_2798 [Anaerospora sp.]|nr:hypothetical protein [Anaerospora sp.]
MKSKLYRHTKRRYKKLAAALASAAVLAQMRSKYLILKRQPMLPDPMIMISGAIRRSWVHRFAQALLQ